MAKKIGGAVLRFFIRAAIGMALIFVINSYVIPADSSINVFRQILQLMWV